MRLLRGTTRYGYVLAGIASATGGGAALADPGADQRDAEIRAFVTELAGPVRLPAEPVKITAIMGLFSSMPTDVVRDRFADVADKPDHPDHNTFTSHLALAESPHVQETTLHYAGPALWALDEPGEPVSVSLGEHEGIRWLWADMGPEGGQLNLTKAGVPFPGGSNYQRKLHRTIQSLRRVLNSGVPEGPIHVRSVTASETAWTAAISIGETDRRATIDGRWSEAGKPFVDRVHFVRIDGDVARFHERVDLSGHGTGPNGGPNKAAFERSDEIIDMVELVSIETITRRDVEARAAFPEDLLDPDSGVTLFDFRRPGQVDPAVTRGRALLVFQPGAPATRVTDASTDPAPSNDSVGTPNDSGSPTRPSGSGVWWVGAALVVVVFTSIGWRLLRPTGR